MKCNKCNHILPEDSEFCQYCGNKLESGFVVSDEIFKCKEPHKSSIILHNSNKTSSVLKKFFGNINIKAKKILVLFAILIICLFATIFSINYFTVQEKAENVVAVYLVDKTMKNNSSNYYQFTSFEKTYFTSEVSGFKCVVKLSGAAHLRNRSETVPFSSTVKINLLSGETSISKLTLDGKKMK